MTDQFGRRHRSLIEVQVDRSATMSMPNFTKRGSGLYERSADVDENLRPRQPAVKRTASSSELIVHALMRGKMIPIRPGEKAKSALGTSSKAPRRLDFRRWQRERVQDVHGKAEYCSRAISSEWGWLSCPGEGKRLRPASERCSL